MRGLALALVALAAAIAAAEPAAAEPAVGFDHAAHAARSPAIPCARCHATRRPAAKPARAACTGRGCHTEAEAGAAPTPRALALDHELRLGHRAHAAIACAQCHDVTGRARRPAHQRCASCHARQAPVMTACEGCHVAATSPGAPRLAPAELRVTTAFSHARHATRGAAKQCVACHAPIAATDDRVLPRPTAATCAASGCHDGKPAFGITAACTRCHQDVPRTPYDVVRDGERFSHAHPAHEAAKLACAACHPFGKGGEIVVAGHAACAGCHAEDFGRRKPKICNACHNGTEPWRPLVADRLPPQTTEFGATLDHGKHAKPACTSCHSLATERVELRPPRGHRACTSSGCHAIAGGPAPHLDDCERCHVRGSASERDRARRAAPWSVRATFRHARHRVVKGVEVACASCHTDMSAVTVRALAVPAKRTCEPCHDGQVAFKLTGTSCTRCHPGARK